jgi:hypothetical protein
MATPPDPMKKERERFARKLARLRASPEERAQILTGPVFDYEAWVQKAGPAKPEELVEMEGLLREREEDRQRSLAPGGQTNDD